METFLKMTAGPHVGEKYPLDASRAVEIGRGIECAIVLTDPLCSRVHAIIRHENGQWHLKDCGSRNGTYVNDQKIDEAVLDDGHTIRLGSTEFRLVIDDGTRPLTNYDQPAITQTVVVRDVRVTDRSERLASRHLRSAGDDGGELVALHRLSIKLLGCRDPAVVMHHVLEALLKQLRVSAVGYLLIDENGALKPAVVMPERSKQPIVLDDDLTQKVCQGQRAVWITDMPEQLVDTQFSDRYTDAICVPLVFDGQVLCALHAYLERGKFTESQFEFAVELANLAAVALDRALKESLMETDFNRLKDTQPGYDDLVGECPAMRELKEKIAKLGRASGSVLVRGESGTGKELIARALHRVSNRATRPLLAVNCAAIPGELMESQLFGHRAGAFTGAERDHAGFFQQADHGTLFLDEIGELPLAGQGKLLRILEGHPFQPVGSTHEVKVDVRVIAATNRDLLQYVREKKFREDLYYRLAVFEVIAPPLRERGDDIGRLVDYFLQHYARVQNRPGIKLSPEARSRLLGYSWPGNVRQLRNVIDSAVVLATDDLIQVRDLSLRDDGVESSDEIGSLRIDEWERKLIVEAMKRTGDNIGEAVKLLGIGRATLYRKLEEYGMKK
ncbi:MAG: sigma 54-interacting transcriptional regulator [Planctomycetaceae bacterium]|nr:sigma 54-interacting transcriptional regulator [Planctomycetaceae bacterium]